MAIADLVFALAGAPQSRHLDLGLQACGQRLLSGTSEGQDRADSVTSTSPDRFFSRRRGPIRGYRINYRQGDMEETRSGSRQVVDWHVIVGSDDKSQSRLDYMPRNIKAAIYFTFIRLENNAALWSWLRSCQPERIFFPRFERSG